MLQPCVSLCAAFVWWLQESCSSVLLRVLPPRASPTSENRALRPATNCSTNASKHARNIVPEGPPEHPKSSQHRSKMAPGGLPEASRRPSQQNVDFRAILRSKMRPCWDPKNCLKSTKTRKKNFQDSFSIAKRRKMMTRDPLEKEGPKQPRQKPGF